MLKAEQARGRPSPERSGKAEPWGSVGHALPPLLQQKAKEYREEETKNINHPLTGHFTICYVGTVLSTLVSPQINFLAKVFVILISWIKKKGVPREVRKLAQSHTAGGRSYLGPQVYLTTLTLT